MNDAPAWETRLGNACRLLQCADIAGRRATSVPAPITLVHHATERSVLNWYTPLRGVVARIINAATQLLELAEESEEAVLLARWRLMNYWFDYTARAHIQQASWRFLILKTHEKQMAGADG